MRANLRQVVAAARRDCREAPLDALVLTAVEMTFRPALVRRLEYVLWALLSLGPRRRLEHLSLGPGQVQLQHWQAAKLIGGPRITLQRWRLVNDLSANIGLISAFSQRHDLLDRDPVTLARYWTGGDRAGFAELLTRGRKMAAEWRDET